MTLRCWDEREFNRFVCLFAYVCYCILPGDNKNIEKTINPNTAAITRSAIKIPRQFLRPGEAATSSCKTIKSN